MPSCDLSGYESDVDVYEQEYHFGGRKVSTKATCSECGENKKSPIYYSYPFYVQDEDGNEKRSSTMYLCEDCYSLSEAFHVSWIGRIIDTIEENFEECYQKDFDMELLDKLTPKARDFILGLIYALDKNK